MCSLLLVYAVLKTLHFVKSILNEEECRSVGEAGLQWRDELAVVLATKPPGVVQESLGVLEGYKKQWWCGIAAERIQSKLCSTLHGLWGELPLPLSFPICTCSSYLQQ